MWIESGGPMMKGFDTSNAGELDPLISAAGVVIPGTSSACEAPGAVAVTRIAISRAAGARSAIPA